MTHPPPTEESLFEAARQLPPGGERADFLAENCGGNEALRVRVASLLLAQDAAEDFFQQTLCGLPPMLDEAKALAPVTDVGEQIGTRIGQYKILEKIGEDGYGVVYLAEQVHPVKRQVALKVIKLGMDTKSVINRFEADGRRWR